ncbi:MAG: IS200/IS605 family transposase [Victivallaceae bacterium]|nr:IS200/IS605 family transposase [Victivallaceae bacterium]
MGHTFSNILYHIIFSTKDRLDMLSSENKTSVYAYLCAIAKTEGAQIIKINGIENHIHILASLKPSSSPSDFLRKIKANSSKWIHEKYPRLRDFAWQPGFSCFSVSESAKNSVIKYIDNQENHHKRISFKEELKIFLEKHKIDFDPEHFLD